MLPRSEEEMSEIKETYIGFAKKAVSLGGTVSAEHGIGKIKHHFLKIMYGDAGIAEMVRVKKVFDPNCILGPDNVFKKELFRFTSGF
jgi:D-lactate dehydrogenase (cytochrome)